MLLHFVEVITLPKTLCLSTEGSWRNMLWTDVTKVDSFRWTEHLWVQAVLYCWGTFNSNN